MARWEESKHPRGPGGKFVSKGEGAKASIRARNVRKIASGERRPRTTTTVIGGKTLSAPSVKGMKDPATGAQKKFNDQWNAAHKAGNKKTLSKLAKQGPGKVATRGSRVGRKK